MSVQIGTEEQIQFALTVVFCTIDITYYIMDHICISSKWSERRHLSTVTLPLLHVRLFCQTHEGLLWRASPVSDF